MLASELVEILLRNPNAKVCLRYDTEVVYSNDTTGDEDVIVDLNEDAVFMDDDKFLLCADLCDEVD